MTTKEQLIADIEDFAERCGVSATRLSVETVNGPGLLKRLKAGGDVKTGTMDKIYEFMVKHGWEPLT